jgi:Mg-chelatase subunit ChlD
MNRNQRGWSIVCLLFALGLLFASPTEAGNGKVRIVGGVKLLDFCVSIRFNATAAEIAEIERALTDGSAVLADATDGQFRFGNIHIVNNSGASEQAEIWIHPAAGRANATAGNYGKSGEHINLFYPSNISKVPSAEGDAYTVAHEMGHQLWGLGDEYTGPGGPAECEAAPGSPTASFCLMDNYFTRGGNSGGGATYTLNEFCVLSNHDPDKDTRQESRHGKSCWQTIAAHGSRSATAPAVLPVEAAPATTAPVFVAHGTQRRFVVLVDRSGSMDMREGGAGAPTRLELAKQAASIFIDLTKGDDELGVASFSSDSTVDFAMTPVTGAGTRASAKAAINAMIATGATAIGSGLITARDMFASASQSCALTIVLLTDGENNAGPSELSVIPSLISSNISVISIAIGGSVSTANLSKIADDTGGRFFQAATNAGLPPLMAALSAEATGGGILDRQPSTVDPGGSYTQTLQVDNASRELTVVLTMAPTLDLTLSLVSPNGTTIDTAGPNVDVVSNPGTRIVIVRPPVFQPGSWTLKVAGGSTGGAFELLAAATAPDVSLVATTNAAQYVFPVPVFVRAVPIFGVPVVGVRVRGIVTRPNGTTTTIDLFDNGDPAAGDDAASDGLYSGRFSSFVGSGSYRFEITAEAQPGATTAPGEAVFESAGAPANVQPVPLFRRQTSLTAVVTGVLFGDRDGDGLSDTWEEKYGIDPDSSAGADGATGDPDGDAVTNLAELQDGTNPRIANVWTLSEGATGFFNERIAIVNPETDFAAFTITFLTETGAPIDRNFTLSGLRRMTVDVGSIPGLSDTAVAAVVRTTSGGVIVERTMMWDRTGRYGGHTGKAISNPRTQWYLAEGEANFFDTFILYANANSSPATVTATYLLDTGETIQQTYTVQPTARLTVYANDVPGLRGHAFSTSIASSLPITVERAMYFSTNGRFWNGGHASAAVESASKTWFVAEGATGEFFDEYLLLANPNAVPVTATIRYLTTSGGVITQVYNLPATSRTTVAVDGVPGLESVSGVSAAIDADQPIIVERAMYWPRFPWYEAHNSAGLTTTGTRWALAEGETGGPLGYATYVLIANPGDADATVTMTFLRSGRSPLVTTFTVPAHARVTQAAHDFALSAGEQFGVLLESTSPIVAERALYWNALGQLWGAGTNETAAKLR